MLIVVWALSIICLSILGIKQATEQAYDGNHIEEQELSITSGDTLQISMRADKQFSYRVNRDNSLQLKYDASEKKVIYSNDIIVSVKPSKDSIGKIVIEKSAEGNDQLEAKKRAEAITYNYAVENNRLVLDGFFVTDTKNKYRDQQIAITVYVPQGTVIYSDESVSSFYGYNSNFAELSDYDNEAHHFRILKNDFECLDCLEKEENLQEIDSLEILDSEKMTDTIQNIDNENWEEELNNNLNKPNDTPKRSRKTVTVTID